MYIDLNRPENNNYKSIIFTQSRIKTSKVLKIDMGIAITHVNTIFLNFFAITHVAII
jgi:hypothetical protein